MTALALELTSSVVAAHPLADVLETMAERGTSVTLNWGEDNNLWEVCWITNGKRHVGFGKTPESGVMDCIRSYQVFIKREA
jgi:hypothetical protein